MSILLVGPSGVGKSQTVNHLFNINRKSDMKEYATTSRHKSQTECVTEYLIKASSDECEVKDLMLGIVDSPGINDTGGTKQDACNFYAIKKFYSHHPNMKGDCFPNLIFVLITAGDKRVSGPNSALSKTLNLLKSLKLIDKAHPNVVGIITHATILGAKKAKFIREFFYLSAIFKSAIFENLGIRAPVVAIENDFEGEELEVDNDWTILADGTRQPLNLFNRCIDLLRKSGDPFGQLILSECFGKCSEPEIGFSVKAKDAAKESLCSEEKELHDDYQLSTQGGIDDDIILQAKSFIAKRNLAEDQQRTVRKLATELTSIGLDLLTASELSIESLGLLLECGQMNFPVTDFLHTLKIPDKQAIDISHSAMRVIGQGYNILNKQIVPSSIFSFDKRQTQFGIVVPDIAELARVNETFEFMEFFESEEDLQRARLGSFNINLTNHSALLNKLCGLEVPGYNKFATTDSDENSIDFSFLLEQRIFELKLGDLSNLKTTDEFRQNVDNLPQTFEPENTQNKSQFENFFQKWGHFFIVRAYGGGSVEMKVRCNLWASFIDPSFVKAEFLSTLSGNCIDMHRFNENRELFSYRGLCGKVGKLVCMEKKLCSMKI